MASRPDRIVEDRAGSSVFARSIQSSATVRDGKAPFCAPELSSLLPELAILPPGQETVDQGFCEVLATKGRKPSRRYCGDALPDSGEPSGYCSGAQ